MNLNELLSPAEIARLVDFFDSGIPASLVRIADSLERIATAKERHADAAEAQIELIKARGVSAPPRQGRARPVQMGPDLFQGSGRKPDDEKPAEGRFYKEQRNGVLRDLRSEVVAPIVAELREIRESLNPEPLVYGSAEAQVGARTLGKLADQHARGAAVLEALDEVRNARGIGFIQSEVRSCQGGIVELALVFRALPDCEAEFKASVETMREFFRRRA